MYQQFDSVRKLRSAARNTHLNSVIGAAATHAFMGERGKIFRLTSDPTYSQFFTKFIHGCEKRMGQALSIEILLEILHAYEVELLCKTTSRTRRRAIVMSGSSLVIGYCGGLRGGEITLTEATSTCQLINEGTGKATSPHVVVWIISLYLP